MQVHGHNVLYWSPWHPQHLHASLDKMDITCVLGVQTSQVYWHYVLVTMAPPAPCMLDVTVGLTDSNATPDGNTKVKVGAVQLLSWC